jgi:hypothetical protein
MKKTAIKVTIFFLLALVLGTVGFFLFAYNAEYSTGNRTGRLMKFSHRGFMVKTYEGQLDVAGISQGKSGMVSSTWDFSVDTSNKEVIEAIDKAMTANSFVKLHYEEKFFKFWWRGDTKYFVTKVEIVPEN